jgi:hypothetical protein
LLTEPTRKRFWPTEFFKIRISLLNIMRFSTIPFYRPFGTYEVGFCEKKEKKISNACALLKLLTNLRIYDLSINIIQYRPIYVFSIEGIGVSSIFLTDKVANTDKLQKEEPVKGDNIHQATETAMGTKIDKLTLQVLANFRNEREHTL